MYESEGSGTLKFDYRLINQVLLKLNRGKKLIVCKHCLFHLMLRVRACIDSLVISNLVIDINVTRIKNTGHVFDVLCLARTIRSILSKAFEVDVMSLLGHCCDWTL